MFLKNGGRLNFFQHFTIIWGRFFHLQELMEIW